MRMAYTTISGDETTPFFGFLSVAAALVFSCTCMGAAYGTAKSGVGVASMGVMRLELVMKSIVPTVMAGVLGIYGHGRVALSTDLIAQKVEFVRDMDKIQHLCHLLKNQRDKGSYGKLALTLVFVETKKGANQLENWLSMNGFSAIAIHGDKVQMDLNEVQDIY